ncbi:MAG: hypothetical protein RIS45_1565 [Planctomycetota bacterium]|jgi:hypothetical protein
MSRFVGFDLANEGSIAVNPEQVVWVSPHDRDPEMSVISLVNRTIAVQGKFEDVVMVLENAK